MPHYDATTKLLVEIAPLDWVSLAGYPDATSARMVDADLSTVTAQADKIIRVEDSQPWLLHIEFQSGYDPEMGLRNCRYNVLAEYHHKLPVLSTLVLLTPDADGPAIKGILRRTLPDGTCYDEFRYQVIRVWKLPVENLLIGGLGTLPLAPLSGVPETELPGIIQRMKIRVDQELPPAQRNEFWSSTSVLLGARLPFDVVETLLRGVSHMIKSSVIDHFREEGRIEGTREFLLELGEDHLGRPDPRQVSRLNAISDVAALRYLAKRVRDVRSWDELLSLSNGIQTED